MVLQLNRASWLIQMCLNVFTGLMMSVGCVCWIWEKVQQTVLWLYYHTKYNCASPTALSELLSKHRKTGPLPSEIACSCVCSVGEYAGRCCRKKRMCAQHNLYLNRYQDKWHWVGGRLLSCFWAVKQSAIPAHHANAIHA